MREQKHGLAHESTGQVISIFTFPKRDSLVTHSCALSTVKPLKWSTKVFISSVTLLVLWLQYSK